MMLDTQQKTLPPEVAAQIDPWQSYMGPYLEGVQKENAEQILLTAFDFFNGMLNDCNIFEADMFGEDQASEASTQLKEFVESALLNEAMTIAYLSKLTRSYLALTQEEIE